ncbi:MAG: ParB/RepB/Spo0J family partition protein [Firmicutes bacterium]|nr:ParB/RepB/Spo0J family partition protein [Bacillota bacterium]
MANTKGLGKGLSALLGDDVIAAKDERASSLLLPISQVESCSTQPRKSFEPEALSDLADSIRIHGIIQPLTVRKLQSGYYQIIAGERRWRAARMAGLTQVPVVVIEADDRKAMELAMIENLQREDLNPMEEAEGYQQLMTQYNLTQEETAQRVGKSRSAVANALRLLNLCPPVRAMVEDGRLSNGHARTILPLSPALQEKAAEAILKSDLSVRQTELLVKKLTAEEKARPAVTTGGLEVNYAEEAAKSLGAHLGRGCKIVSGRKKGRIELEYYGVDDLNNLLDALNALKLK